MKHRYESECDYSISDTARGYVGCGVLVHLYSCDFQVTENDVRSQEKTILMWKCGSCLMITASSIIGTGSKNRVLGVDKHNFITIIWGGAKLTFLPVPSARIEQRRQRRSSKKRRHLPMGWADVAFWPMGPM